MPNWCSTAFAFKAVSNEKEATLALSRFHSNLSHIYDMECRERKSPSAISPWLGRVLTAHGIDSEKVSCRGWFEQPEEIEDIAGTPGFRTWTETAWGTMPEVFYAVIKLAYSDNDGNPLIDMYWMAEEPGMGLYLTNDSEGVIFTERVMIEGEFPNSDIEEECFREYYDTEEAAIDSLIEYFPNENLKGKSLEEIAEILQEISDGYFHYERFEICEDEDINLSDIIMNEDKWCCVKLADGKYTNAFIKSIDVNTGTITFTTKTFIKEETTIEIGKEGLIFLAFDLAKEKETA